MNRANKEQILRTIADIKRKPKKSVLDYLITELIKLVEVELADDDDLELADDDDGSCGCGCGD
jgi:hypothetical protein